jgi:hypothetical protein
MENYILRIYRRDERYPERVVGIVEDAGTGERLSFGTLAELTTILSTKNRAVANEGQRLELA